MGPTEVSQAPYASRNNPSVGAESTLAGNTTRYVRLFGYSGMATLSGDEARRVLEDATQARLLGLGRPGMAGALIRVAKTLGVDPPPFSAADREMLTRTCALSSERE